MLGIAEGTVKSRCARGRAELAVLLGHLRRPRPAPAPPSGRRSARRPGRRPADIPGAGPPSPRRGTTGLGDVGSSGSGSPGTTHGRRAGRDHAGAGGVVNQEGHATAGSLDLNPAELDRLADYTVGALAPDAADATARRTRDPRWRRRLPRWSGGRRARPGRPPHDGATELACRPTSWPGCRRSMAWATAARAAGCTAVHAMAPSETPSERRRWRRPWHQQDDAVPAAAGRRRRDGWVRRVGRECSPPRSRRRARCGRHVSAERSAPGQWPRGDRTEPRARPARSAARSLPERPMPRPCRRPAVTGAPMFVASGVDYTVATLGSLVQLVPIAAAPPAAAALPQAGPTPAVVRPPSPTRRLAASRAVPGPRRDPLAAPLTGADVLTACLDAIRSRTPAR